jgi:hypothetical protein
MLTLMDHLDGLSTEQLRCLLSQVCISRVQPERVDDQLIPVIQNWKKQYSRCRLS